MQEVKATLPRAQADEVILKVRAAINGVHGVDPMEIALLSPRTIRADLERQACALENPGRLDGRQNAINRAIRT